LIFTEKTRAARNYSQGNRGTQGKIAKKAEKMRIFRGRVEITAKNAVPGLGAGHSNGFSNANISLTDAAKGEFAKIGGAPHAANLQGPTEASSGRKVQRIKGFLSGRKGARPGSATLTTSAAPLQRESA